MSYSHTQINKSEYSLLALLPGIKKTKSHLKQTSGKILHDCFLNITTEFRKSRNIRWNEFRLIKQNIYIYT